MAQQQQDQTQPQQDQNQFRGDGKSKSKKKNPELEDTLPPSLIESGESDDASEDDETDKRSHRGV